MVDELRAANQASAANQPEITIRAGDLARLILSMQELEPGTADYDFLNSVAVRTAKQLLAAIGSKPGPEQPR